MGSYHRLASHERYQIQALRRSQQSVRQIARVLGRAPSSISREIRRNFNQGYRPWGAQQRSEIRRQGIGPPKRIQGQAEKEVGECFKQDWSPEQISGRTGLACVETIYQYVYRDRLKGGDLWKHLRRKRRRRWSQQSIQNIKKGGKNQRSDRVFIENRPRVVEKRDRLGDYERDLIVDKKKAGLLTIVDRANRWVCIVPIPKLSAENIHQATLSALKDKPRHTLTNDNGSEFNAFKKTSEALGIPIYFTTPYASWQRGTNENMNGLIRNYFPKGTSLGNLSPQQVARVQHLLNNRPRKSLGYKTPLEVFTEKIGVLH